MLPQASYKRIKVALRNAFGTIKAHRIVGQASLRAQRARGAGVVRKRNTNRFVAAVDREPEWSCLRRWI